MPINPNTAEPGKPRRRWFQFRLRTMLIAVALIGAACAYVAHEAKIVRDRVAYIRRASSIIATTSNLDDEAEESKIPWIRRMLGDAPMKTIGLPLNSTMQVRNEGTALFPEATIMAFRPWKPGAIPEMFPFPDSTASIHNAPSSKR